MRKLNERDIEAYARQRVKAMRGEIRKVKWIARRDAPDRFVMLPGYRPNFWVEFKAPGKGPSPGQAREHKRMRNLGELVYVVDSLQGVEEMLA